MPERIKIEMHALIMKLKGTSLALVGMIKCDSKSNFGMFFSLDYKSYKYNPQKIDHVLNLTQT